MDFTKTFKYDHLARSDKGKPLAHIILWNEREYVEGEDLKVSIMSIPVSLCPHPLGQFFYIDTYKYVVPNDLNTIKYRKNGLDWHISNFVLKLVK